MYKSNSHPRSLLSVFILVSSVYVYDNSVSARPQFSNETQTSSSSLIVSRDADGMGQIPHFLESRAIAGKLIWNNLNLYLHQF